MAKTKTNLRTDTLTARQVIVDGPGGLFPGDEPNTVDYSLFVLHDESADHAERLDIVEGCLKALTELHRQTAATLERLLAELELIRPANYDDVVTGR